MPLPSITAYHERNVSELSSLIDSQFHSPSAFDSMIDWTHYKTTIHLICLKDWYNENTGINYC